jgi:molybdate transport system regulatory protein
MQTVWDSTVISFKKETVMKPGARNQLTGKVTSIKSDEIMSLVKFSISVPKEMASVLTTESVKDMGLKIGDEVDLVIKAIHVLPLKR